MLDVICAEGFSVNVDVSNACQQYVVGGIFSVVGGDTIATLIPSHGIVNAQVSAFPYTLATKVLKFSPGPC